MLARCPECDRLVRIVPTGVQIPPTRGVEPLVPFSASWKEIVPHLALNQDTGGPNCLGSGRRV